MTESFFVAQLVTLSKYLAKAEGLRICSVKPDKLKAGAHRVFLAKSLYRTPVPTPSAMNEPGIAPAQVPIPAMVDPSFIALPQAPAEDVGNSPVIVAAPIVVPKRKSFGKASILFQALN